jgi:hypothetical protein
LGPVYYYLGFCSCECGCPVLTKNCIERERERERERAAAKAMATGGTGLNATGEFFRRRDDWRRHPMVGNQLRHATPGLGIAIVAFGIYLVGEAAYNRIYRPAGDNHH